MGSQGPPIGRSIFEASMLVLHSRTSCPKARIFIRLRRSQMKRAASAEGRSNNEQVSADREESFDPKFLNSRSRWQSRAKNGPYMVPPGAGLLRRKFYSEGQAIPPNDFAVMHAAIALNK